jgi:hypothetical protein
VPVPARTPDPEALRRDLGKTREVKLDHAGEVLSERRAWRLAPIDARLDDAYPRDA